MNAPTESPTKRTRAVDVQVPGAPAVAPVLEKEQDAAVVAADVGVAAVDVQVSAPAGKPGRGSYRNTPSADIDHTKLTAPVMTADGWLCPPAPAAKV